MTITESILVGLSVVIATQTTFIAYKVRNRGVRTSSKLFIDTSVLMDGRVLSVASAGFLMGEVVIPRSVIAELQLLADKSDHDKRAKARRGLDVIRDLQSMDNVTVEILQDGSAPEGVDDRLISLTRQHGGALCTLDFNLNKVASVQGIQVLNINELAKQLRMVYVAGDTLRVRLGSKGQDKHQAVGHLDDGTMVVVEHAVDQVGKTVDTVVIRSLQTDAGRMVFAKLESAYNAGEKKPQQAPLKAFAKKALSAQKKDKVDGRKKPLQKPQKTTPKKAEPTQKTPSPRHKATNKRSRVTPEDRLIALANKQNIDK